MKIQKDRCNRTACQALIGEGGYIHQHNRYRYCLVCARKINAACPEAPPFDINKKEQP